MKKIFAFASALLLLSSGSALAETLKSVGIGEDGLEYYIDLDTVQRPRPLASFTLVADLDPPNKYKVTRYSIFEWVNCETNVSTSRTKTTYYLIDPSLPRNLDVSIKRDKNIRPYTSAKDTEDLPIEPGTMRANAFNIACSR